MKKTYRNLINKYSLLFMAVVFVAGCTSKKTASEEEREATLQGKTSYTPEEAALMETMVVSQLLYKGGNPDYDSSFDVRIIANDIALATEAMNACISNSGNPVVENSMVVDAGKFFYARYAGGYLAIEKGKSKVHLLTIVNRIG